jgi:hypothetical protein
MTNKEAGEGWKKEGPIEVLIFQQQTRYNKLVDT